MARKAAPPQPPVRTTLITTMADAQSRIGARIMKGREILQQLSGPGGTQHISDYESWTAYNEEMLRKLFNTDEVVKAYDWAAPTPDVVFEYEGGPSAMRELRHAQGALDAYLRELTSIGERLELYADPSLERTAAARSAPNAGMDSVVRAPAEVRSSVDILENLASKFHVVARQLLHRHANRATLSISDEYDVQDLLHALLLLEFEDVRQEEWAPSYAGAASRMDFLLKNEQIVVEAKCTREGLGAKEVGEQLLVDIAKYQSHPHCKRLFCFVYDPQGRLHNPRGLESDLSGDKHGLPTEVRIRPRFS